MATEKATFSDFLATVAPQNQEFVQKLHEKLLGLNCVFSLKEAKSGYLVSYQLEKKTIMNWVFRKSGILARIYGNNAGQYEDVIASLPDGMKERMISSNNCKRLLDPTACSGTCVMGFIYELDGVTYKKCRNDGMFFLLTDETGEGIDKLVSAEIAARKSA